MREWNRNGLIVIFSQIYPQIKMGCDPVSSRSVPDGVSYCSDDILERLELTKKRLYYSQKPIAIPGSVCYNTNTETVNIHKTNLDSYYALYFLSSHMCMTQRSQAILPKIHICLAGLP